MRFFVILILKLAALAAILFVGVAIYAAFVDMGLSPTVAVISVIGFIFLVIYAERDRDAVWKILKYPFRKE